MAAYDKQMKLCDTIMQQASSFRELGYEAEAWCRREGEHVRMVVVIVDEVEHYRFSEPDLDIVIKQLANLYKIKQKERKGNNEFVKIHVFRESPAANESYDDSSEDIGTQSKVFQGKPQTN